MHIYEVLCHGENGGATWELIMRKVVGKAFTAGGRFDFFLDSDGGEVGIHKSLSLQTS